MTRVFFLLHFLPCKKKRHTYMYLRGSILHRVKTRRHEILRTYQERKKKKRKLKTDHDENAAQVRSNPGIKLNGGKRTHSLRRPLLQRRSNWVTQPHVMYVPVGASEYSRGKQKYKQTVRTCLAATETTAKSTSLK